MRTSNNFIYFWENLLYVHYSTDSTCKIDVKLQFLPVRYIPYSSYDRTVNEIIFSREKEFVLCLLSLFYTVTAATVAQQIENRPSNLKPLGS